MAGEVVYNHPMKRVFAVLFLCLTQLSAGAVPDRVLRRAVEVLQK